MALTREQSLLWQAMDIGPQWLLRSSEDPLLASEAPQTGVKAQAAVPVARAQPRTAPTATLKPAAKPEPFARRVPAASDVSTEPKKVIAVQDAALAAAAKTAGWDELKGLIARCHACAMAAHRMQTVPSDGAPGCPLVIIGEAPGRDEDLEGIPFVGKSGQLLTAILKASGIERGKDAAVINVLKCRPPGNRDPLPEEAAACRVFLDRQLELLQPKALLLMGKTAVAAMMPEAAQTSISRLRGSVHEVLCAGRTVKAVVSYHPSYLLRNPAAKEVSWHDILTAKSLLAKD